MGPFLCVLITDPDDIQIVLKHENSMSKPFVYQYAKSWVGQGIITAPVEIWRQHRKIIAPTFNRAILENYIKIFHSQSDILIKQLKKYSNKNQHFNVFNCISRCTLDIILESAMGLSINCQTSPEGSYGDQYIKCTNRAFEILYERTFKILYVFDEIFKFSPLCKEFMKCVDVFHQISDKVGEIKNHISIYFCNFTLYFPNIVTR
jgi:cytochrome P450 family 4